MLLLTLLLLALAGGAQAKPAALQEIPQEKMRKEAVKRMRTRAQLLAKARARNLQVPLTPQQQHQQAEQQRLARVQSRTTLTQPAVIIGPDGISLPDADGETANGHSKLVLQQVMQRLKKQLGKPYVWGGQSPEKGFDCSGLVYYAFNPLLKNKLPRTADSMYRHKPLKKIAQGALKRGDLIFFNIKGKNRADHVGVYLGDGRFIEAPRTGLNIRISKLADKFWQSHYLGARRVLNDERVTGV